jgi:hypothetical protein
MKLQVKDMVNILKKFPQDATIYLSSDPEGNSYGSVEHENKFSSLQFDKEKNILVIFPWQEHMDYDELK